MNHLNNTNSNYIKAINLLFAIIPLSYIVGSFVLNLNIVLLILLGFLYQRREFFKIKLNIIDKLILVFFCFTLITGLINILEIFSKEVKNDFTIIYKTFFYLRYLFLYFVLRLLVEKNVINFKWFFVSASLLCLFVSFDIFFQFFYGKDIFGLESLHPRKLSGPFGSEVIAGGYLQRFALLIFFIFPVFLQLKNRVLRNVLIIFIFTIILLGILFSGNRMPLFLFLMITSLIIILEKKTRIFFPLFILSFSLSLVILYNSSTLVKNNLSSFYLKVGQLSNVFISNKIDRSQLPDHFHEFETFYDTWLMNKYIGGGIKSFRFNCPKRKNIDKDERSTCNTHPHNYYLEILTDLGVVGLILVSTIFFLIFYKSFIKKYFLSSNLKQNHLITPFIFIFIAEIFPIKSSGSFFTTGNSTIIFLVMAIIVGLVEKKDKI